MAYIFPLPKRRAAVKVQKMNGRQSKYCLTGDICIMKAGTMVIERPGAKIIGDEGNEIHPTGRFLWSAETIDPFHLVTDMF